MFSKQAPDASLFRALFEAAPDAMIVVDIRGVIMLANSHAEALFGYNEGALTGMQVEMLLPASVRQAHIAHRTHYMSTPRVRPMGAGYELTGVRADGQSFPVEIGLSPVTASAGTLYAASIRDISETQRARQALERARFDAAVAQISRLLLEATHGDKAIAEIPDLVTVTLGIPAAAIMLIDPHHAGLRVPASMGLPKQALSDVPNNTKLQAFASSSTGEAEAQDAAIASLRDACPALANDFADAAIVPLRDRRGPMGLLLGLSHEHGSFDRDRLQFLQSVANILAAAIQRGRSEEQLAHAQRLDALGQLTGGIAHDFNNALQGIISSLELASLSLDRRHAGQAKRHVMVSLDAALRAGRLTQRLLSLARRQTASSQCTCVTKVLSSMRELLDRTLGDDITLDVSFPEDLPSLACDSGQLESALVNLAVNARDAMSGHGHLSMACRVCAPDDSGVQVALDRAHSVYVEITVSDDGPGMSEETRRRAFEPFFTTKPEGHGTGLGLSMVYGFMTQYGGAVDIRSMPGAGTSVLLYLPCDEATLEALPPKESKPTPDLRGFRVLVVEDNETIRQSVATRLRQLGCDVSEAASGDQALSMLAASSSWNLLLSDVDLPTMDGYELCRQARKQFPALRVILMTGYADTEWLDGSKLDGATQALIKPFDMGDLLAKAQLLLQPETS